jgi:hypothetical protein
MLKRLLLTDIQDNLIFIHLLIRTIGTMLSSVTSGFVQSSLRQSKVNPKPVALAASQSPQTFASLASASTDTVSFSGRKQKKQGANTGTASRGEWGKNGGQQTGKKSDHEPPAEAKAANKQKQDAAKKAAAEAAKKAAARAAKKAAAAAPKKPQSGGGGASGGSHPKAPASAPANWEEAK